MHVYHQTKQDNCIINVDYKHIISYVCKQNYFKCTYVFNVFYSK